MEVEITDLNHRLLIEKAREDLRALEKNMDVLYMSGSERTVQYTKAIIKIVGDIENRDIFGLFNGIERVDNGSRI